MSKGKGFFSTLPGVVSGIAVVLTAIVGLLTVSVQLGWIGGDDDGDGGGSSAATTVSTGAGGAGGGGSNRSTSGGAAELTVDKTKLTFVPLQTKEMTVTVTNDGTGPVTLRRPEITGTDSGQYTAAFASCPTPLGPGVSCPVRVTFAPTKAGKSTATLVVTPADGGRAVQVQIEGNHLL